MSHYKVIILDFDGVIVESVRIKDQAFEEIFREYPQHLPAIMEYHRSHNAVIRYDKFKHIYEKILGKPYSKDIADQLSSQFSKLVFEQIVACPFVVGAKVFLEKFSPQCRLSLVSINPPQELREILEARNIRHFFNDVYAHPWAKDDAISDILRKHDFAKEDAVFVGDSPEDFKAAQIAGIDFIARQSDKSWEAFKIPVFADMREIQRHLLRRV